MKKHYSCVLVSETPVEKLACNCVSLKKLSVSFQFKLRITYNFIIAQHGLMFHTLLANVHKALKDKK